MSILEYAINMELDGEKYYREQAEINKNNSLNVVCTMLADEEKSHAQIIENLRDKLSYELKDSDILTNAKNIFMDTANIKVAGKEDPSQLDFYRIASDMEKQSVDLYKQLLSKATQTNEKELFEYLIKQENQHFEILHELSLLLNRSEEWIESAEFGQREDY